MSKKGTEDASIIMSCRNWSWLVHAAIITLTLKLCRSRKIQRMAPRTNHRLGEITIQAETNRLGFFNLVEERHTSGIQNKGGGGEGGDKNY